MNYSNMPESERIFVECGQCGHLHHKDLPGNVDCRDDSHRFTFDQLDTLYGLGGWTLIDLAEQCADERVAELIARYAWPGATLRDAEKIASGYAWVTDESQPVDDETLSRDIDEMRLALGIR